MDFIWLKLLFFQTFVLPELVLIGKLFSSEDVRRRTRPNITETSIYFDPEDYASLKGFCERLGLLGRRGPVGGLDGIRGQPSPQIANDRL